MVITVCLFFVQKIIFAIKYKNTIPLIIQLVLRHSGYVKSYEHGSFIYIVHA